MSGVDVVALGLVDQAPAAWILLNLSSQGAPRLRKVDAAPLPDATVVELPGLGHFGPLERPDQVAASVIGALSPRQATPGP